MKKQIKHVIIILLALLVSVEVLMAITGGSNNNTRKPTVSVKNGNGLGVNTSAGGANNVPSWARNFMNAAVGGAIQNPTLRNAAAGGAVNNPVLRNAATGGAANTPTIRRGLLNAATGGAVGNPVMRNAAIGGMLNVPAVRNALFNAAAGGAMQYNDTPEGTPLADGPVVDPQTQPGGYAFPFINRGINGQKSIIPFNGMTDPFTGGSGFGTRYSGNWGRGGGGYGGYDGYSSLPAWYLNLVNWNIR